MPHYVDVQGNVLLSQSPLMVVAGFLTGRRINLRQIQEVSHFDCIHYGYEWNVLDRFRQVFDDLTETL